MQKAAQDLFDGVAPERNEELKRLWEDYQPRFWIVEELGPNGRTVMEGGLYRDVQFNHRSLRLFWLASFIAWEGYVAVHNEVTRGAASFARFRELLGVFESVRDSTDSTVTLPPVSIQL